MAKAKAVQTPEIAYQANTVLTSRDLDEVVAAYYDEDRIVFDVETVATRDPRPGRKGSDVPALDERTNRVLWIALAAPGRVDAIPMGHPGGPEQLERYEVLSALKPLFLSQRTKINQNVKFDILSLAKYWGELPPGPYVDLVTLVHLLNENLKGEYNLGALGQRYLDYSYAKLAKEGAPMDGFSFDAVARYVGLDAKITQLVYDALRPRLEGRGNLEDLFFLENNVTEVLVWMKQRGALIDRIALGRLNEELAVGIEQVTKEIHAAAGHEFNIGSNPQLAGVLYDELGLPCKAQTNGGARGVDSKKALRPLVRKHPIVPLILKYRDLAKLQNTYASGLNPFIEDDDRIRCGFNQNGTVTGRFSCVSGDTLLPTTRGVFRFDEYQPAHEDRVLTHCGEWRRVLGKIYKGRDQMFRVTLSNGASIDCTLDHRVLTPAGWTRVGDLHTDDEVFSYVGVEGVRLRSFQHPLDLGPLPWGREADYPTGGRHPGDHPAQRAGGPQDQPVTGAVEDRAGAQVLTIENGGQEPHVGQEWFPTSQLEGLRHRGWPWVLDAQGRWALRVGASDRDGRGARTSESAPGATRSSSGREPEEQQPRQLGSGDNDRSSLHPHEVPWAYTTIRAVDPLGELGVWDIEVEGVHSYLAGGFLNHNSSKPNLQNIPRQGEDADAQRIRSMFLAPPGHALVVGDYKQIEARLMAHYAGPTVKASKMLYAFNHDVDLHLMTAAGLFDKPIEKITKEERQAGKTANFLLIFGGGPNMLIQTGGYTTAVAEKMYSSFHATYPEIDRWSKRLIEDARKMNHPAVETLLGRRRRLPDLALPRRDYSTGKLRALAERQAVNAVIQGSAADFNKMAMVRVFDAIKDTGRLGRFHIVLTVHDEIVLEVPEEDAEEGVRLLRDAMEGIAEQYPLRVPLLADIHYGPNWASAK